MTLHSSSLGRGGHRDDRRRRLLAEDHSTSYALPEESPAESRCVSPIAHKSQHYGDAAFLETQTRITDLVPRHPLAIAAVLCVGVAMIAAILALYVYSSRLLHASTGRLDVVALGKPGSLGNWFSSLLLLAASFWAVATYSVRRHKTDDYRGRYRVWLWAALCWFLVATDLSAGLHQAFQQVLIELTHTRLYGDGSIWWLVPAVLLIGGVGAWLLIDMQSCRLSSAALLLAAIAYITALVTSCHLARWTSETGEVLLVNGSLLAGHLLLAGAMALHARFVLLDAEGRLPRRPPAQEKKPKPAKAKDKVAANAISDVPQDNATDISSSTDESPKTWVAVDPPHGEGAASRPPVLKRVSPTSTPAPASLAQDAVTSAASSTPAEPGDGSGKLSKADRKALKKKQIEQRLKAEQRKASNW